MDLALISVVADTAAAFGVIGSLIFVGFQVKQNSVGLHNAAAQSQMVAYQDVTSNIINSPEVAEVFFLGLENPEKLEGTSLNRFYAYGSKMLRTFQGIHWQWRRGALDDELFDSMATLLEDFSLHPGWQLVWRVRRHQFDVEFQKFMDTQLATGEGRPLYPQVAVDES